MKARTGLYDRIFAWFMARAGHRYEELIRHRKTELLGGLSGTVLEIGAGTGPNLRFAGEVEAWLAVEPNVYMYPYFRREARGTEARASLLTASAEELPLPDESVDRVVSTLVLCSVDRPAEALGEILRVLRPGGAFVFVEHVAAPEGSLLRRIQSMVRPVWKALGDGCRPDRDTGSRIRAAGFDSVELDAFRLPLPVVGPHVAGVARKAGGSPGPDVSGPP